MKPDIHRDRTAFVFRRIALPERLLRDGWWICADSFDDRAARAPARDVTKHLHLIRTNRGARRS